MKTWSFNERISLKDQVYGRDKSEDKDQAVEQSLGYPSYKVYPQKSPQDDERQHGKIYQKATSRYKTQFDVKGHFHPIDDKEEPCRSPDKIFLGQSADYQIQGHHRSSSICECGGQTRHNSENQSYGKRKNFFPRFILPWVSLSEKTQQEIYAQHG